MADSTISQLPPALSVSPADLFPIDQGGVTKRATLGMLGNGTIFVGPGVTLTVNATMTFNGTNGTTMTFPATDAFLARTDASQTFTGLQTFTNGITTPAQITSTIATGTPPFVIASTTNVPNLNASFLNGATFAAPGPIGGGTPGAGSFTTIDATGQITSTLATGTAPFVVASTTPVANLSIGGSSSSTTGNAATATALQNARTIDGVSFDGTANITVVAPATHAATNKTTPVAADEFPIYDSVSGLLNHVTYANLASNIAGTVVPNSGIFHVEATTGSNALTVTLKAGTVLDFRSTTLTTGVPNTRTVPSDISMVVSAGSTLGTYSAVGSNILIVAIDNAGTVELAVTNIATGLSLNETELISTVTEGGTGTADLPSVFYSTTSRASVPFRVVGSVISTQTTAGNWAQTLTVQGGGGNALITQPKFRPHYASSPQTITAAGALTLAHGLRFKPSLVTACLQCQTGEYGYSAGQEIETDATIEDIGGAAGYGVAVVPDSTNLNIRYGSGSTTFRLLNFGNGVIAATTNANWKIIFKAWL